MSCLRSAMESNVWGGARFQCFVKQGPSVARANVETAIDQAADLTAISSRGRTGLSRPVLGSVAREMVRLSPVRLAMAGDRELALAS
ncbi:MAG: universal stress protein [Dehalococcoidia bacterium]|nr:universal stress protein [Dehalococcoidia bacterium]